MGLFIKNFLEGEVCNVSSIQRLGIPVPTYPVWTYLGNIIQNSISQV